MKIWGDIPKVSGVYGSTGKIGKIYRVDETAPKKDELTISGTAQDFNVVMKALRQVPDVRKDRVDEIAQKMERGEYKVKASEIAEKMIHARDIKKI